MKLKPFFFLVISIIFLSCNSIDQNQTNKIVILGISELLDTDLITQTNKFFISTQFGRTDLISDEGKFKAVIEATAPIVFDLHIGRRINFPIFANPNDSIHIRFNELNLINKTNGPIFTGSSARENKTLYQLNQILKFKRNSYNYFYDCEESIFFIKLDSLQKAGEAIILDYKDQSNSNPNFIKAAKNYLDYNIAYFLEKYPIVLKFSFARAYNESNKDFAFRQKNYFVEDSSLLNHSSYRSYLSLKVYKPSATIFYSKDHDRKGEKTIDNDLKINVIDSLFQNKSLKEYLKFSLLYNSIKGKNIKKSDIEKYKLAKPPSKHLEIIEKELSELGELYEEGIAMPNYSFLNSNDELIFIDSFRGKVLYVDIWATWCAPCHAERKYFEQLIIEFEKYQNDISFVGLSVDKIKDKEKWKKMIERENIEGLQFLVEDDINSPICKYLRVNAIPRFFIVGRNGELIHADAPSPSSKEIRGVLKNLII